MDVTLRARKTDFVKEFTSTPEGIECPHFWVLGHALGCPYSCDYCYLQKTLRRTPKPELFTNVEKMTADVERWMGKHAEPKVLNAGELSETLGWEKRRPFIERLIHSFAVRDRHFLLFLSKSDDIEVFDGIEPTPQVILSWSVNAPSVAATYEHMAPSVGQRLRAAGELCERGWRVRLRIDPMLPVDGWKIEYSKLMAGITRWNGRPERVTLGSLRWLPGLRGYAANKSVFDFANVIDGADKRHRVPRETRMEMYAFAVDQLERLGVRQVGLCKEVDELWETMSDTGSMWFARLSKGKCNCTV